MKASFCARCRSHSCAASTSLPLFCKAEAAASRPKPIDASCAMACSKWMYLDSISTRSRLSISNLYRG